jgi:hypothetical protein
MQSITPEKLRPTRFPAGPAVLTLGDAAVNDGNVTNPTIDLRPSLFFCRLCGVHLWRCGCLRGYGVACRASCSTSPGFSVPKQLLGGGRDGRVSVSRGDVSREAMNECVKRWDVSKEVMSQD